MQKKVTVTSPYKAASIFGPQGQRLIPTVRQDMCGTTGLSACMVYMPPGRIARPHAHNRTDIVVVVIEGYACSLVGEDLQPVYHGPGEFIFIPEGVPHVAVNLSTNNRLIAIEMRTDPKFNEDVAVLPAYDERTNEIVANLQRRFSEGVLDVPAHWDITDTRPFTFAGVSESELL